VGTEYHWYILGHQTVRKLDANAYTTAMTGSKFKLAHKRADKATWSASENAQKKKLIRILTEYIQELEKPPREKEMVIDLPSAQKKGRETARKAA
jgi:hypothetical protein